MKIIVISDSHRNFDNIANVIEKHDECDEVFFLGDGYMDINQIKDCYPKKKYTIVAGNCDFVYGTAPDHEYRRINHKTIFLTHGHIEGVKMSVQGLIETAVSVKADIALHGHTHFPCMFTDERTGILIMNPGSINEGQYAILEINLDGKIIGELKRL